MASAAKNTALMTMASIGQKIISFAYFTLIARMIGAEGTGKYFFVLSFTTVFVVFVDLGFTQVLIREVAKGKEKAQQYLSSVFAVKLGFGLLTYLILVIAIHALGYDMEIIHMVYLSGVTMLFDSLHLTMYGIVRAMGDLRYEATGIIGSQLLTLALGSYFLMTGKPLIYLILAFTIPSGINLLYISYILVSRYHLRLRLAFNKKFTLMIAKIAIPFAIAGIFARVYSYIDSIILSRLVGDVAVGLYSIPYKITYAFQFVPLALVATMYPRFSEHFVSNKKKLAEIFEQSIIYLLIVVIPIAIGISVLAHDIITIIYTTEYLASVVPLRILLLGLVFSYISFPIGACLNACSRQVTQTVIVGIVMVVNIALNLMLIPIIGIYGAALSALAGNTLLTVLSYAIVPSIMKVNHTFLFKRSVQILIAGVIMGGVVAYVNMYIHFAVAILVGAIVYMVMLFVTGAMTVRIMREFAHVIRR